MDDVSIGIVDRLALSGHQLACRVCRNLHAQMKQVEKAVTALPPVDEQPMPAETEARISKRIREYASKERHE